MLTLAAGLSTRPGGAALHVDGAGALAQRTGVGLRGAGDAGWKVVDTGQTFGYTGPVCGDTCSRFGDR
jgi:hypothetical protein